MTADNTRVGSGLGQYNIDGSNTTKADWISLSSGRQPLYPNMHNEKKFVKIRDFVDKKIKLTGIDRHQLKQDIVSKKYQTMQTTPRKQRI